MNRRDRDDKCGLCDEWSPKNTPTEYRDLGMARCLIRTPESRLAMYVAWDSPPCISYRLDRPNLAARRQYIAIQQQQAAPP